MLPVNMPSSTISGTTSSARAAYPVNGNCGGVRVYNAGAVPVFLKSGDANVAATTSDQFLAPAATAVFARNPNDTHLAAITATSTAVVYFGNCNPLALTE